MIDRRSVAAVDTSRWRGDRVKPLYDSYCFSRIPSLIPALFEGRADESLVGNRPSFDTVILLLIDGFGWRFIEEYGHRYSFLQRFMRDGLVTKLTSQFPSTTAAHITTIHTGLEVGQSGIYEWFIYEPSIDEVIAPLPFNRVGESAPGTLTASGVRPESLFPTDTLYLCLRERHIASYVYQSRAFTPSPFTNVVTAGAELHPFERLEIGLVDLVKTVSSCRGPSYHYLYAGEIDALAHEHGPESTQVAAATDACLGMMESTLMGGLSGRLEHAMLLMTADHGQIQIDPKRVIYVNRAVPGLDRMLALSPAERRIMPSGVWRDMFLHIDDTHLEEAVRRLQDALHGVAEVCRVKDLAVEGFFGSQAPADAFARRIGNVCILPNADHLVWWDGAPYQPPHFRGHHGGLTRKEMETELMSYAM